MKFNANFFLAQMKRNFIAKNVKHKTDQPQAAWKEGFNADFQLIQVNQWLHFKAKKGYSKTCLPQLQYTKLHGTSPTMQVAEPPPEFQNFLAPKSPAFLSSSKDLASCY